MKTDAGTAFFPKMGAWHLLIRPAAHEVGEGTAWEPGKLLRTGLGTHEEMLGVPVSWVWACTRGWNMLTVNLEQQKMSALISQASSILRQSVLYQADGYDLDNRLAVKMWK